MSDGKFTPGPWEYVPGTENHGPYVAGPYGGDIADCYCMSNPLAASIRNGGDSYPVLHQGEQAEANARLIAAAPDLVEALQEAEEYFDNRADADHDETGFVPNEEMKLLTTVRAALAKAGIKP